MPFRPGLPRLIATDLDGTLVRSDETVSAYSHEVLARIRQAGIPLAAVTGRGPRALDHCRRDIPAADYLVLAQGGRVLDVTDPRGPRTLRASYLDGALLSAVIDKLEAAAGPLSLRVEVLDELGGVHGVSGADGAGIRDRVLAGAVLKVYARSVRHSADRLLGIAAQVLPPDTVSVAQSGLGRIEIAPPMVSKASGLAVVAQSLGVDPQDVLVFGDATNDLPMFAWAGWGRVAVSNAHPAVLEAADGVTLSNDQDGVATWLDRLVPVWPP